MQAISWLYNKYIRGELDWDAVPYTPPKFDVDDPKAVEYLDVNGYVVFKGVATQDEVVRARALFWDWVESIVGWEGEKVHNREDHKTWGYTDDGFWPADRFNGIVARNGIGQSPFLWYCRTLPKVKALFTLVWGDDDLLTSFDGCGVLRPPEVHAQWLTHGSWFHIDQNMYNKPGRHAVQGLLNLFPSGPNDGGFVAVPKSASMMDDVFNTHDDVCSKSKGDFVPIRKEAQWWIDRRRATTDPHDYRPVKLCVDAGDFILWDSRCVHCNHPASPTPPTPTPTPTQGGEEAKVELKRLAAYICMTPTRLAKNLDELIVQRVFSFQTGIGSTHWPHEFKPTSREGYASKFPVGAPHVKLTPEQAKLITGNKSQVDVYEKFDYNTVQWV